MVEERKENRVGRGAVSNRAGRFEPHRVEQIDDGWGSLDEELPPLPTEVRPDPARSIITRNRSPDVGFEQSINPYRGCEHGCIYCYARPSHAYVNLSPGLDFETKLFYKQDAAKLLTDELAAPSYRCSPIMIGANTDPYQPIEHEYRITRSVIEVLQHCRHPFSLITKSAMVLRDLDILGEMARDRLVHVTLSITSLDPAIKRTLEPRTASPQARLRAVRALADAGVPVSVMVAPVIPVLTDAELESILQAAREAGASGAGYVLLRLPHEIKELFREWLEVHEPLKAQHVMSRLQAMRGGRDYDARWGIRQRGVGEYAQLLQRRFELACQRCGLNRERFTHNSLSFSKPERGPQQFSLV